MKSVGYRFLENFMKVYGTHRITDRSYEWLIKYSAFRDKFFSGKPPYFMRRKYDIKKADIGGISCFRIAPKGKRPENALLFIHGGAFIMQITVFHYALIAALVDKLEICVYVPIYPLAPAVRCDKAVYALERVYDSVLRRHRNGKIIFAGDSAGGSICLSLAMLLRNKRKRLPERIVLMSPCSSLCVSRKQFELMKQIEKKDVMLSTKMLYTIPRLCAQDFDKKHFLASPLYGDFRGLPETVIYTGTGDLLCVQALLLASRLKKAGCKYKLYMKKDMMHVWPMLPCKEGREGLADFISSIKEGFERP